MTSGPGSHYDALVVGVGGMGASALAHLALRGLRCIGLEQDEVPSLKGSSSGETRVIRMAYFEDPRYVPLLKRAYELWRELEQISGRSLYVCTGALNFGPPHHPAMRALLDTVKKHEIPCTILDESSISSRFPALVPTPGDIGIFETEAGYLRPEDCTRAHADVALAHGAVLRTQAAVTQVDLDAPEGVAVLLADGTRITAAKAVISAGCWLASSPALRDVAGTLPLQVERQVQLWFPRPLNSNLPTFLHFSSDASSTATMVYGIPTDDSLKVCQHHGGECTTADLLDRAVRPSDEEAVRSFVRTHIPTANGPLLRSVVCMYCNTLDQHFAIGTLRKAPHVVVLGGFSGHGFKFASVVGEIAVDLLVTGATPLDISLFDLARFD